MLVKPKILFVEDYENAYISTEGRIRREFDHDIKVDWAPTVAKAKEFIDADDPENTQYAVLLLDIILPDGDGTEVLDYLLKATNNMPETRVLVQSGEFGHRIPLTRAEFSAKYEIDGLIEKFTDPEDKLIEDLRTCFRGFYAIRRPRIEGPRLARENATLVRLVDAYMPEKLRDKGLKAIGALENARNFISYINQRLTKDELPYKLSEDAELYLKNSYKGSDSTLHMHLQSAFDYCDDNIITAEILKDQVKSIYTEISNLRWFKDANSLTKLYKFLLERGYIENIPIEIFTEHFKGKNTNVDHIVWRESQKEIIYLLYLLNEERFLSEYSIFPQIHKEIPLHFMRTRGRLFNNRVLLTYKIEITKQEVDEKFNEKLEFYQWTKELTAVMIDIKECVDELAE